jgi:hypothetical protein
MNTYSMKYEYIAKQLLEQHAPHMLRTTKRLFSSVNVKLLFLYIVSISTFRFSFYFLQ